MSLTILPPTDAHASLSQPLSEWRTDLLSSLASLRRGRRVKMSLARISFNAMNNSAGSDQPSRPVAEHRYDVAVVDSDGAPSSAQRAVEACGVLLVPRGREHEYLFGSLEGQLKLTRDAGFRRLIFVSLTRHASYSGASADGVDMAYVQQELQDVLTRLGQRGVGDGQIPVLSPGKEHGERKVLFESESQVSGRVCVEDVTLPDEGRFRRLIFLSSPGIIQSEAVLLTPEEAEARQAKLEKKRRKKRKKKKKPQPQSAPAAARSTAPPVDFLQLTCSYQEGLMASLVAVAKGAPRTSGKVLLVGLGGGNLPMFMHEALPDVSVDVVELDPVVCKIAKAFFHCVEDDRLAIHVGDGFAAFQQLAGALEDEVSPPFPELDTSSKRDAFIIDVNSTALTDTESFGFPPQSFLSPHFLEWAHAGLADNGVLLINLVPRSASARRSALERVMSVFPVVYASTPSEGSDLNQVVCALKLSEDDSAPTVAELASQVEAQGALSSRSSSAMKELLGEWMPRMQRVTQEMLSEQEPAAEQASGMFELDEEDAAPAGGSSKRSSKRGKKKGKKKKGKRKN